MKALYFINSADGHAKPGLTKNQIRNELSVLCQKQACVIAEKLVQEVPPNRFLRVLTCPDFCSQAMAEILSEFSVQLPKTINAFKSMDMGDWSGQSMERILSSDLARFQCWQSDPNYPAPGGESITDYSRRVWTEVVNEVERSPEDEDLVFFVPEKLIAVVACQVLDAPLASAHLLTMRERGITTFRKSGLGMFQLESWSIPWNAGLAVSGNASEGQITSDLPVENQEEDQVISVPI